MALVREVRGWEHVEAARAAGKGIVALEPHLGNWELGALYLGQYVPVTFLYRPARQAWADELSRRGRERGGVRLATPDVKGVRAMLQALKRGEGAGVLPDQVASKGDGVWVPFFGRPAYTPTLAYRLVQSTGAVPLLFFCERLDWGQGFRLWVMPTPDLGGTPAEAAGRLNGALEALIRQHPDQYLWSYRRYKRPPGAPPPEAGP
jgi:KDO2-lipid IV(A) lauroyltransferase